MAKAFWMICGAVALLSAGCAPAPDARDPGTRIPAELPPASFEGRQYVDSTGCAFIRAGPVGTVTWVPRVSRTGTPICGAEPSLAGGA